MINVQASHFQTSFSQISHIVVHRSVFTIRYASISDVSDTTANMTFASKTPFLTRINAEPKAIMILRTSRLATSQFGLDTHIRHCFKAWEDGLLSVNCCWFLKMAEAPEMRNEHDFGVALPLYGVYASLDIEHWCSLMPNVEPELDGIWSSMHQCSNRLVGIYSKEILAIHCIRLCSKGSKLFVLTGEEAQIACQARRKSYTHTDGSTLMDVGIHEQFSLALQPSRIPRERLMLRQIIFSWSFPLLSYAKPCYDPAI